MIEGVPTEINIEHLQNRKEVVYSLSQFVPYFYLRTTGSKLNAFSSMISINIYWL
jgi:hypothetical protein